MIFNSFQHLLQNMLEHDYILGKPLVQIYQHEYDRNYDISKQPEIRAAIALLRETGAQIITHHTSLQRFAVVDGKIIWFGNVDFLAYGRKDSDVLRFIDSDTAGELLDPLQQTYEKQIMLEDV